MKIKAELEKEVKKLTLKLNAAVTHGIELAGEIEILESDLKEAKLRMRDIKQQANYRGDIVKYLTEKHFIWPYNL